MLGGTKAYSVHYLGNFSGGRGKEGIGVTALLGGGLDEKSVKHEGAFANTDTFFVKFVV